jgi:Domain of unknown function (DUF4124)
VSRNSSRRPRQPATSAAVLLIVGVLLGGHAAASTVYKWIDESGTVHLSTTKPPAGVRYETLNLGSTSSKASRPASSGGSVAPGKPTQAVSPAQVAQRSEVLSSLQNRECVIALEALDRLTSGTKPTSATELTRLKQTAEVNCSRDAARRREQEEMAARLRVANGPECVAARNKLVEMKAPGSKATRESLQSQQAYVDEHCIAPVQ